MPDPRPRRALRRRAWMAGRLPRRDRALRLGLLGGGLALLTLGTVAATPDLMAGRLTTQPVAARSAGGAAAGTPGAASEPTEPTQPRDRPDRGALRAQLPIAPPAPAQPAAPAPPPPPKVAGIPQPCPIDLPITDSMSAAAITTRAERQWGLTLSGPQWRDNSYRPVVKLIAETLDSVDCTDYLHRVKAGNGGQLEISSRPTRSWAWGDYGLTRAGVLTLDLAKFKQGYAEGDRGRLVRLVIHEMAHSLNADRDSRPAYWQRFNKVWNSNGPVSSYGSTPTESFADAVGYYVARCAADNPYATGKHRAYYDYVKTNIFGGREFGGAVGTRQSCDGEGR